MGTKVVNYMPALRTGEHRKVAMLLQMFGPSGTDVMTVRECLDESGGDFNRAMDLLLTIVCLGQQDLSTDTCFIATPSSLYDSGLRQAGTASPAPYKDDVIEGPSTFPVLPWELFIEILSYVSKKDLCALRLLDTFWREAIDTDQIWKDALFYQYGRRDCDDSFGTWKERFIAADRLRWSVDRKSHKVELSNKCRTAKDACKGDEKFRWVTVLSDNVFSAGRHYIEIIVDQCCDNSKNTIKLGFGAIDKCSVLTHNCPFGYSSGSYTTQDHNSWVYLADGRIMARNQYTNINGQPWNRNDRIGVLIDFYSERLSFYWNSKFQGQFLPMICTNLHVAVSLIGGNQVTLTNSSINTILG